MRGDRGPVDHGGRYSGCRRGEHQEDASATAEENMTPGVPAVYLQLEHPVIESFGGVEIVDVEARLQNSEAAH
jgi:hypothetical protein